MAFSLASRVSAVGDAERVRSVYVPALSNTFLIYTARVSQGTQFYSLPLPAVASLTPSAFPVPGSEVLIGSPVHAVDSFYAIALSTAGHVLILFEDSQYIWRLVFNYLTSAVVESPTQVYEGSRPVLASSLSTLFSLYLRNNSVQMRINNSPEQTAVSPSAKDIVSFAGLATNSFSVQYAGAHKPAADIATALRPDASSYFLYMVEGLPSSDPIYTGTTITDLSGNSRDGSFSRPDLFPTSRGIAFTRAGFSISCGSFPFGGAITTETWLIPAQKSYSSTLYSGPINLVFSDRNYWTFSFSGASYRAQTSVQPNVRHNVTVSHTFGSGSATFIAIDGIRLNGQWVTGTGNETPALAGALSVSLGESDILQQFKVSSVAKSLSSVRSYIGGLS